MNSGRDRDESIERLLQRSLAKGDSSAAGAGADCPDAETLAAWADRGLAAREMALVEAHASSCARCQALLAAVGQATPDASPSTWETWRRGWTVRWLAPLAAGAAAAVILWVTVPGDERPALPEQARAQLPSDSLPPSQPDPARDCFVAPPAPPAAPAAPLAQPGDANATTAAESTGNATSVRTPEREQRKEAAEAPSAADRTDSAGARAADVPFDAGAARSQSALSETVTLSRQAAKAAPPEVTSPDPQVRWRIAGIGSVELTTNGGASWDTTPTGISAELTAGASPSRLVCWLVGRAGTVLVSTDGRTWRRAAFPDNVDLAAVQAVDAQSATVTTADGRVFRTTDGGLTWVN